MSIGKVVEAVNNSSRVQVMDDFFSRVEFAINACHAAAEDLKYAPSEEKAEEACLACRSAVQLFFFARTDFGSEIRERAKPLQESVISIRKSLEHLIEHGGSDTVRHFLQNVVRRQAILDALVNDDASLVKRLLKQEFDACL